MALPLLRLVLLAGALGMTQLAVFYVVEGVVDFVRALSPLRSTWLKANRRQGMILPLACAVPLYSSSRWSPARARPIQVGGRYQHNQALAKYTAARPKVLPSPWGIRGAVASWSRATPLLDSSFRSPRGWYRFGG